MIRDTSKQAYIQESPRRKTQKGKVLDYLRTKPNATDFEVGVATGIARHLIPDRRGELVKDGLVSAWGIRRCKISGKQVTAWCANYRETLF
jgi:hypothetical protein